MYYKSLELLLGAVNDHSEMKKRGHVFTCSKDINREEGVVTMTVYNNNKHLFGVKYDLNGRGEHGVKLNQYTDEMLLSVCAQDLTRLIFANGLLRSIEIIDQTQDGSSDIQQNDEVHLHGEDETKN